MSVDIVEYRVAWREERKKKKGAGGKDEDYDPNTGRWVRVSASDAAVGAKGIEIFTAIGKPKPNLADELVAEGGFTLDPLVGQLVKSGVAVAIPGHTEIMSSTDFMAGEKGRAFVRDYVHKMAKAEPSIDTMVGGWYDREHDEVVLDWVEVFKDRNAGIAAGKARNQMAVFDLAAKEEIPTGGTGDREAILAEQRARAAGRREAAQALGRDDRRGAGPPGGRDLRRDAPQPRKAQVVARLVELRDKTGLKKGGGGQQQVYAGHGHYGTAYEIAVARAEAAKQRKAASPTATKPTIGPLTVPSPTAKVNSAVDADLRTAAGVPPEPNPFDAAQAAKAIVQRDLAAGLVERAKTDPDLTEALRAEVAELGVVDAGYVAFRLHVDEATGRRLLTDENTVEFGARLAAQRHMDQWAATSSDTDPHALAAQKIAAERFDLDSAWVDGKVKFLKEAGKYGAPGHMTPGDTYEAAIAEGPKRKITESILDVQYANTQATLKKAGIKELTLARGVGSSVRSGSGTVSYQLSPMSSWSSDHGVANDFANIEAEGSILVAKVPASRVISTFATGAGCLPESEYIILGSPQPETVLAEPPGEFH